ncbi:hypothetical protein [Kitasatospora sp. NPDC056181]|uniref:hypothetical protein n=1 Tax=Kitasatospora sp. NPDC056181 TaxID=3345737 RepID=UPI0035E1B6CD
MSDRTSYPRLPRSERLAGSPVERRAGQWWLVSDTGSILATNPTFTGELDRFATAMAAAERDVARLRHEQAATREKGR